jgi:uncharacterized protein YebE (UPF0316 family)
MKLLITFIALSIVNVVFSTIRSITTIKSGKTVASLISGGYFAFYNIMLIYTVADFPMWQKCVITFACNVVGVWIVKLIEEKMRKDKLWKIEVSIKGNEVDDFCNELAKQKIPFGGFKVFESEYYKIEIFAATQKESLKVKEILKKYETVKYFVSETKAL